MKKAIVAGLVMGCKDTKSEVLPLLQIPQVEHQTNREKERKVRMKDTQYAKSVNGIVHVISPLGGEHTLCGDAFDIDSEETEKDCAWVLLKRSATVTCPNCINVITVCRGVRTKTP